jgi:uncharacterized protein (DUF362 family)
MLPAVVKQLVAQQASQAPQTLRTPDGAIKTPLPGIMPVAKRSTVSLVRGEQRRKIIYDSMMAIDNELAPALKRKKYVIIKPNITNVQKQLSATHADALHGILDYLARRFKGPIIIAESSAGDTMEGYDNYGYPKVATEHRSQNVKLVDLNEEAKYVIRPLMDQNMHLIPVRLAARFVDPEAFIICAAVQKTHNSVIATGSVKNLVMGAPLHSPKAETTKWHDKHKYHLSPRWTNMRAHLSNYNLSLTAQHLAPYWGAAVIDGFEGMEGEGPVDGFAVPSRIAMASLDYIAADRVSIDAMQLDASWVGYLQYCEQLGLGNYDLSKIDIRGEKIEAVSRKYRLDANAERHMLWMTPLMDQAGS